MSELPRVYNYFATLAEVRDYLRGKWEGVGLQAAPRVSSQVRMSIHLSGTNDGLRIRCQGRRHRQSLLKFWFLRAHRRLSENRKQSMRTEEFTPLQEFGFQLNVNWAEVQPAASDQLDVDYARLAFNDFEMIAQGLLRDRMHLQIGQREVHGNLSIYFSGVLNRIA
ncbi:MAG: hypothetical protein KDK27_14715 [Leptospiraceae bacterium]|nr:hypothetical protein [Leptospiraceae bacterium]